MVTIREFSVAEPTVAARVVELQQAAYAVEAALIGFNRIPPLHESVEDVVALELVWVGAFEDDDLIGGLGYSDDGLVRDIDRLFVDPAMLRRGIGQALVSEVLDAPEVRVSTGTANEPATTLYRALGFVEDGVRTIAPGVTVTSFILSR